MSKPIKDHNTNLVKSTNTDNNILTAPDGRFIIVDEPLASLPKSGKPFVQLLYIIIYNMYKIMYSIINKLKSSQI